VRRDTVSSENATQPTGLSELVAAGSAVDRFIPERSICNTNNLSEISDRIK